MYNFKIYCTNFIALMEVKYVTLTFWFQPGLLGKNYLNLLPKTWDKTWRNLPTPALTEISNVHHHDCKYNFVFNLANNEAAHKIKQSLITDLLRRPQTKQENAPPWWQTYFVQYKLQYKNLL